MQKNIVVSIGLRLVVVLVGNITRDIGRVTVSAVMQQLIKPADDRLAVNDSM